MCSCKVVEKGFVSGNIQMKWFYSCIQNCLTVPHLSNAIKRCIRSSKAVPSCFCFVSVHNLCASIYLLLHSEGVGIRQQLCELRAAFVILISKQVEVIYWLSAQQSPMGITRVCSSSTTPEIEVSILTLLFRLSLISNPLQPQCAVIAAGCRDEMSGSLTCRSVPN